MINYSLLGKNIRDMREEVGVSQNDLALAVGISKRRLSALENGHVDNISLNTISKIAELFSCKLGTLIVDDLQKDDFPVTTNLGLQHTIDCANYLYRNPFRKISTFSQLFLILPLINLEDLFDAIYRVRGCILGNEDYVAQAVGYAYHNIPESKAKSYIDKVLELIESEPWDGMPDKSASEVLKEKENELLISDPEFEEEYNSYFEAIEEKADITKDLLHFMEKYDSAKYKLMRNMPN